MKYAGIGSRATPRNALIAMKQLAEWLYEKGYVCSTGGAKGADTAFQVGANDKVELHLPYNGYNGNYVDDLKPITGKAFNMAAKYHPKWDACRPIAKKMHARNCYIVLGETLDKPVDFIICWTEGGRMLGGTAQALRIAIDYDIPVFNLGRGIDTTVEEVKKYVETICFTKNIVR